SIPERGSLVIPLSLITLQREQRGGLLGPLNPFRGDRKAEAMRQTNHAANQRGRARIVHHGGDEPTIDLERVDLELAQVVQARGAGAEIVQRDARARATQHVQRLLGTVQVLHQGRLCYFELHALWPQSASSRSIDRGRCAMPVVLDSSVNS